MMKKYTNEPIVAFSWRFMGDNINDYYKSKNNKNNEKYDFLELAFPNRIFIAEV